MKHRAIASFRDSTQPSSGKPDLTIDPKRFVSQMSIVDRYFDASSCDVFEGTVGGTGYRRILRFDTVVINGGDGDLVAGDRIVRVSINLAPIFAEGANRYPNSVQTRIHVPDPRNKVN